jgi:hypothetical protein
MLRPGGCSPRESASTNYRAGHTALLLGHRQAEPAPGSRQQMRLLHTVLVPYDCTTVLDLLDLVLGERSS